MHLKNLGIFGMQLDLSNSFMRSHEQRFGLQIMKADNLRMYRCIFLVFLLLILL